MALSSSQAVTVLSALAHGSRLDVFRLLLRKGPEGLPAGHIAEEIGARPNTLSSNLALLENAGLIRSRRDGRLIIYSAETARAAELIDFLIADCCDGHPERCFSSLARLGGNCE